ncbi:MAG: GNAT family protein [Anaerolineae bacterium]|jgi:RimJ/RimL family protein N-acetyltransferase|nr:GNAT family protein [Anaerolineae bacterium]
MIPPYNIILRQATAADAREIVAGINEVCAEKHYFSTPHYIPTPQWEIALRSPERAPDHLLYVVENERKIIGAAQILPSGTIRGVGELGIFLLSRFRNRKIGTELVMAILDHAKLYYDDVVLFVLATNGRAIRCFKKCGFAEHSRRLHNYAHLGPREQIMMQMQ